MQSDKLKTDLISQPQLWSMVLEIHQDRVNVALFPPTASEPCIYETLSFDTDNKSLSDNLKEAIYDNPLLLSDFKKVDCLIGTDKFIVIPMTDDKKSIADFFDIAFPSEEAHMTSDIPQTHTTIVYAVDDEAIAFLRRTFYNISIQNRLAPIIRLGQNHSGDAPNVVLISRNGKSADIIMFSDFKLTVANTFLIESDNDLIYYLNALIKAFEIDNPKILLRDTKLSSSDGSEFLTKYFNDVRPLILSSDLIRGARNQTDMPLTLIATKLCE